MAEQTITLIEAEREALAVGSCHACLLAAVERILAARLAAARADERARVVGALFAEAERMDSHDLYSDQQANGMEAAGHFVRDLREQGGGR